MTQYLLDRGNQQDWFDADDIRIATVLAVIGLISFIIYSFKYGARAIMYARFVPIVRSCTPFVAGVAGQ